MKFGISTACFYPEYTETAVEELGRNGVKLIEIFLNTFSEVKPAYAGQLKKRIDEYGMEVAAVHPFSSGFESFLFFTPYYRRFLDGLEQYQQYFDFMNRVGAKIFVLHGNRKDSPFSDELYFERFALLEEKARRAGVVLAQENVGPFKSGKLDFLERLNRALGGKAKFVLDIKQTVRAGENVFDFIERLGKNIIHCHLSDHRPGADCLPIGEGSFSFDRFFGALAEKGFCGTQVLELYRDNYRSYEDLYRSLQYLEQYQSFFDR